MPVPLTASALKNDDDIVPVQVLSYLGGSRSGWGETPVERSDFLNISPEPQKPVY